MDKRDEVNVTHMIRKFRRLRTAAETERAGMEEYLRDSLPDTITTLLEWCFYIAVTEPLTARENEIVDWLLRETFDPEGFSDQSFVEAMPCVIRTGPRMNFATTWSSTAIKICADNGITKIQRFERSLQIGISQPMSEEEITRFAEPIHDRMTEMVYLSPLTTFETGVTPAEPRVIPIVSGGMAVLDAACAEFGLAMDEDDRKQFMEIMQAEGRDPTDSEVFMDGQVTSEHTRHGNWNGLQVVDNIDTGISLMQIVKDPWRKNPGNTTLAFRGGSAIAGPADGILVLMPADPLRPSPMVLRRVHYDPTSTQETHNNPSMFEPFEGGGTGPGGRIRDNQTVGRGGLIITGGGGYCVGSIWHPKLALPWRPAIELPGNVCLPIEILIRASDGVSFYHNCFGEPLTFGFVRMTGLDTPDGHRGWYKPIVDTVGIGQMDHSHIEKGEPEPGMLVILIGGPAYRIGVGGGSASSKIGGDNTAALDFASVQRAGPEMEQRLNRAMRTFVELGDKNPVITCQDLGAGGLINGTPEIVYPAGGEIYLDAIPLGDETLSALEIMGNESQERNLLITTMAGAEVVRDICVREGLPMAVIGHITGNGRFVVRDRKRNQTVIDLPLEPLLGETKQKIVRSTTIAPKLVPLDLGAITISDALRKVFALPSIGSKGYLIHKGDRSVGGCTARQQGVGPNQLPLADCSIVAQSIFGKDGIASTIGEQPIKGLISPQAMARLAVTEALLNMCGALITRLSDVKVQANWMWPAKLPGEGAKVYAAACAMSDFQLALGQSTAYPIGGKDSLSMALRIPNGDIIKAPGQLVIAAKAPMADVSRHVTPDLKGRGNSLYYVSLSPGKTRLGGSALAEACNQLGDECPDVEDVGLLRRLFCCVQNTMRIAPGLITAVHDVSDGGVITAAIEMAMAGSRGLEITIPEDADAISYLFSEEPGLLIECHYDDLLDNEGNLTSELLLYGIPYRKIGRVGELGGDIVIRRAYHEEVLFREPMLDLRELWTNTSFEFEKLQRNPTCVAQEKRVTRDLIASPNWHLTFEPRPMQERLLRATKKPPVAIIREQGSNGDREMAAAFFAAGFEPWDVTMSDLAEGRMHLKQFRGAALVGGFSFRDVPYSAKGWASKIRFNPVLADQFAEFFARPDTFSLGVCNGCQLMALLGVLTPYVPEVARPRFIQNVSGKFESRFVTVEISPSPAIMLQRMIGSRLGVWIASGEGQAYNLSQLPPYLISLRYTDPLGTPTEVYPFNPNGSPDGIAGICSADGRHLAMMPHPERLAVQMWQWPWMPKRWRESLQATPWSMMFQSAYDWCMNK